jgi:hypothetical protein
MKLVMTYAIGDDCTWWANEVIPFEYESAEAALVDFDVALKAANKVKHSFEFDFAGHHFNCTSFFEWSDRKQCVEKTLPDIQTLEEWFDSKNKKAP